MATRPLWLTLLGLIWLPVPLSAEPEASPAPLPLVIQVDRAIDRASEWLDAYPHELRFDSAVMLSQIRALVDNDALAAAFARARRRGDHDHDHPHRRFWMPDFRSLPEHTSRWQVPAAGERRVNTNRVLSEALHCAENGWRAETEAYICAAMRDEGGYQTTHGIWALDIARGAGCVPGDSCIASLRSELESSQPVEFRPERTLDVDLYAERALMLLRTGTTAKAAAPWVEALLELQEPTGSWGRGEDPDPYYRYHATAMTAWALAEWRSRR